MKKSNNDNQSKFDKFLYNLRQEILGGVLLPKERLIEEEISKRFNVSRGPLREAFRTLESEGLINIVPRKGAYVSDVNMEDIEAILQVRIALESLAVKLACQKMTDKILANLAKILNGMGSAVEKKDDKRYFELNKIFHTKIYEFTQNKYLIKMLTTIAAHSYRYRFIPIFYFEKLTTMKKRYEKHIELFEAFSAKDENRAVRIRVAQITHSASVLKNFVRKKDENS